MYQFWSSVLRDPAGYEWVNEGGWTLDDGAENYAKSLILKHRSHEMIRQRGPAE